METKNSGNFPSSSKTNEPETKHKSSVIPLGPCHVCGARSTGYHFGVVSCEACKSFFRRTIKLSLKYTCLRVQSAKCPLRQIKGEKPPCPACRFNKCLELGMAVQAIKRGRYSHAKRAETIIKIQKNQPIQKIKEERITGEYIEHVQNSAKPQTSILEKNNAHNTHLKDNNLNSNCSGSNSWSFDRGKVCANQREAQVIYTGETVQPEVDKSHKSRPKRKNATSNITSQSSDHGNGGSENLPRNISACKRFPHIEGLLGVEVESSRNNICSNEADQKQLLSSLVNTKESDMDKVIQTVVTAYNEQNFVPRGFLNQVQPLVHKYLLSRQKEFQKETPIPAEEHRRIYKETGQDVDGRLTTHLLYVARVFEDIVEKISIFLLQLPGFKTLSADDRCTIVKCRGVVLHFQHWVAVELPGPGNFMVIINSDKGTKTITREEYLLNYTEEVVDFMYNLKIRWEKFNFTAKEDALFLALVAISRHDQLSDDGKLKCDAMSACLNLCLKKTFSVRMSAPDVLVSLEEVATLIDDILKFCEMGIKENDEIAKVYRPFLEKEAKLALEIFS